MIFTLSMYAAGSSAIPANIKAQFFLVFPLDFLLRKERPKVKSCFDIRVCMNIEAENLYFFFPP
jgi:hypothetical protein